MKKRIILTGAPGSGKTSVINALENDEKYFCIHETAREMIDIGLSPSVDSFSFQKGLLALQIAKEDNLVDVFETMCRRSGADPDERILLLDRSAYDGHAYITDEAWEKILSQLGLSEEKMKCRYDAVIFFESSQENYETDSARHEDFDTSRRLGERLYEIYSALGYEIYKISETEKIDDKIAFARKLTDEICRN